MNRCLPTFWIQPRHTAVAIYRTAVICGLAVGVAVPVAMAQVTALPAGTVPAAPAGLKPAPTTVPAPKMLSNSEKTSSTPTTALIVTFVKENVARLVGDDADVASVARGDLVTAAMSPNTLQPSSVIYLDTYINALAKELTPLLAKNLSMRAKLNIGIVAAKVADSSKPILPATALQSLIQTLLQDPNEGVALWGMKAAAAVLTAPNQTAPNGTLLRLILPTIESHKLSGAITQEAYGALQDLSPQVIDTLLKLYARRVGIYKTGTIPQDPTVERHASAVLTVQAGMWSKLTVADRLKVMNLIADLLSDSSKAMLGKVSVEEMEQLRLLLIQTGAAVSVVADGVPDVALHDQAIRLSKAGTNTPPATMVQMVAPVVAAIRTDFPQTGAAAGNVVPSVAKP